MNTLHTPPQPTYLHSCWIGAVVQRALNFHSQSRETHKYMVITKHFKATYEGDSF